MEDQQVWCISILKVNRIRNDKKMKANVNEMLTQELHKTVIKKIQKRKVYARFKDNILAADLAEMGSLSSKNQGVKY